MRKHFLIKKQRILPVALASMIVGFFVLALNRLNDTGVSVVESAMDKAGQTASKEDKARIWL